MVASRTPRASSRKGPPPRRVVSAMTSFASSRSRISSARPLASGRSSPAPGPRRRGLPTAAAFAALAFVAAATAGCDPGWGIAGRVLEHPRAAPPAGASGTVAAAGRPVAGAKLELACASRHTLSFVTTSGSDGAFQLGALGVLPSDCTLAVSAPGYRAQSYRLAEYCTGRFLGACSEMHVPVELDAAETVVSAP